MKSLYYIFSIFYLITITTQKSQSRNSINLVEIINYFYKFLDEPLKAFPNESPDVDLTISDYLHKYNYPLETHTVTTEDGYILILHRIPHGHKENSTIKSKPVVFLKHCFLCTSMEFIYVGPGKSLAMYLADLGYDVWLGNSRGNRYSIYHQQYDTNYNSKKYWNFSFHEKGYYDLASDIDYIINKTQRQQITYIGYSQGTTEGLILTSSRPEYNKKINLMVLLAPTIFLSNVKSQPFLLMYKYRNKIEELCKSLNIHGIAYNNFISIMGKIFCSTDSPLNSICSTITQTFAGFDYAQFNDSLLSTITASVPAGGSIKEFLHYGQIIKSGTFEQFDYGKDNIKYYNSLTPPEYNLSKVTVPVAIYYGQNDLIATPEDVRKLITKIPNLIISSENEYKLFTHFDFIFAKDPKRLIYDKIVKIINLYNF